MNTSNTAEEIVNFIEDAIIILQRKFPPLEYGEDEDLEVIESALEQSKTFLSQLLPNTETGLRWVKASERLPEGKKAAINTQIGKSGFLTIEQDAAYFDCNDGDRYVYKYNDKNLYDHIEWLDESAPNTVSTETAEDVEKWRPMRTAPKDGTKILVLDKSEGVMWVSWEEEQVHYPGCKPQLKWCVPGSHQDEQGGAYTAEEPLGWLPLPDENDYKASIQQP
jgi:hypothetical protein